MANKVFANGREVSCKAADGKTICAFPDVCWSPPPSPAGPIPVPYPNTGFASDTTNGSKTVKITGKEVMLKDKSYFKKSTGDEPATMALPKGLITGALTGKVYFNSWSMDVKFEGENVDRHFDVTTHNHNSFPGNTPTWPYMDSMTWSPEDPCYEDGKKEYKSCQEYKPYGEKDVCDELRKTKPSGKKISKQASNLADKVAANKCLAARRCRLEPYDNSGCCKPQTPHHLIEASALHDTGRGGRGSVPVKGLSNYEEGKAPCVCAEGVNQNTGTHGLMHTFQSASAVNAKEGAIVLSNGKSITAKKTSYGTAKKNAVDAFTKTFPESKCNKKCIEAQLDSYHKNKCGINDKTTIKAVETGQTDLTAAEQAVVERSRRVRATRATDTIA